MLVGNKGEWSEVYVLIKLLGDGGIYAGDGCLNKVEEVFYPILQILRSQKKGDTTYNLVKNLIFVVNDHEEIKIEKRIFEENAVKLFEAIKKGKGSSFQIPLLEEFLSVVKCSQLKAESASKSDIKIVIYDSITSSQHLLGFSIKSKLGGNSTIFNSANGTNFIFEINNLKKEDVEIINSLVVVKQKKDGSKKESPNIRARLSEIIKRKGQFKFIDVEGDVFRNNLILISEYMPAILGEMVVRYYSSDLTSTFDLYEVLYKDNPLNYDYNPLVKDSKSSHDFYSYKIKKFLVECSLGMVSSKVWNGKHDATGGYIVVKENGETLCYHLYNRNNFEDFLLKNTYLDTPSTTKFTFGSVFIEEDKFYIKLNLQIKYF
jgi:hypothetical protein